MKPTEEPVKLPQWVVVVLIGIFLQTAGAIFLAGAAYQKVQLMYDILTNHETRLEYLERKDRERGR